MKISMDRIVEKNGNQPSRRDIVGHRVMKILQSECVRDKVGIPGLPISLHYDVAIVLENDEVYYLTVDGQQEPDADRPLFPIERQFVGGDLTLLSIGDKVADILTDYHGCLFLIMENGTSVSNSDDDLGGNYLRIEKVSELVDGYESSINALVQWQLGVPAKGLGNGKDDEHKKC
jgi:hypothetical protein